jgi:hypothetical protein
MKWRHAALLAGLTACRTGGPSANPEEYVVFPDASTGLDSAAGGSTTPPAGDDGETAPPGDDAGDDADATPAEVGPLDGLDGASNDSEGGDDGASSDPEGGTCSAPTVAVCDPVHNTGCDAVNQCDVNPLGTASMPTGLCVFPSGADAAPCLATSFTESCPAKSTCASGACRLLCFCDGDCPMSQCCSGSSGAPGFNVCGSCP